MKCIYCNNIVADGNFCSICGHKQLDESNVLKEREITLQMIYQQVMRHHIRRLTPKGQYGYTNAWKFLMPLADRPIRTIKLYDYQEIIDSQEHLSLSHQKKIQSLISFICKRALLDGLIPVNYAPYLELGGYRERFTEPFTYQELNTLLACAQEGSCFSETAQIILILCFTGWRPEELFQIKREDVNLDERYFISGSKTEAGKNRLMPILEDIWPFVLSFYYRTKPFDYLIKSPNGCRIDLKNWRNRKFYPCLLALGINTPDNPRRLKPYSARHTFATLAYRAGVKEEMLTKMIGHVDFKFTIKRYIHNDISDFHLEAKKITAYFNNITEEGRSS